MEILTTRGKSEIRRKFNKFGNSTNEMSRLVEWGSQIRFKRRNMIQGCKGVNLEDMNCFQLSGVSRECLLLRGLLWVPVREVREASVFLTYHKNHCCQLSRALRPFHTTWPTLKNRTSVKTTERSRVFYGLFWRVFCRLFDDFLAVFVCWLAACVTVLNARNLLENERDL